MDNINFESGLKEYTLNGAVTIRINPTDHVFVDSLFTTFEKLEKLQAEVKSKLEKTADKRKVFEIAGQCNTEIRAMIDEALGAPVCEPLFGSMSVCALANGLPVWCNLMLAILDEVSGGFSEADEQQKKRMAEYTKKYKR